MIITDPFAIIETWRDALAADADLAAWCLSEYTDGPYIYAHLNPRNVPSINKHPFIVLNAGEDVTGLKLDEFTYTIQVACCVNEQDMGEVTSGKAVTCEAAKRASQELGKRVLNILSLTEYRPGKVRGAFVDDHAQIMQRDLIITVNVSPEYDGERTW